MTDKYSVSTKSVESLLSAIRSEEIAIPEIQRPFVWKARQVRDLIDSLYSGYPTGYLIISQNPSMKMKDGSLAQGKKIMIDGQQRITALMTSIVGQEIITEDFRKKRIVISYNPLCEEDTDEERFKVLDSAIKKDKKWIQDISVVFSPTFDSWTFVNKYCTDNPQANGPLISQAIARLIEIKNRQIGLITLNTELTIDEVTEIFIRINNQGTKLNQADFAMSRIAANTTYGGNILRKAIDYYSHLAVSPEWYGDMIKDTEFVNSEYFHETEWLKDDKEDLYDADYNDILRTSFMYKFGRAKMKDLVSLLSGRDFETREYREDISEQSFKLLKEGVIDFMNQYRHQHFILLMKSIGVISKTLINSSITLDFAFTLYLLLHSLHNMDDSTINRYVKKWYVLTTLTSRYITSPESVMDSDLRNIKEKGFAQFFNDIEAAELSDTFWNIGLVQKLETSSVNSPAFNMFIAAQIYFNDDAMFTEGTKVSDLIKILGDVHHIFPRAYLKDNGFNNKDLYNQIANFTYITPEINKAIKDDSPSLYFSKEMESIKQNGKAFYGNIADIDSLRKNLENACIPEGIENMTSAEYPEFLGKRRVLMAQKIRKYYESIN